MRPTVSDVFRVSPAEAEEAVETLAQAFLTESATNYFFPAEEGLRLEKLRVLFASSLAYRMLGGIPALGIRESGMDSPMAGVATLSVPAMPEVPQEEEIWRRAAEFFGPEAQARIDRYDQAHQKHRWPEPHHYVVAIGVRPEFQGRGFGGALINAAIAIAEEDPASTGIGLDTGTDQNQAIYEHFGFRLYADEPLGIHRARYLFRAKR